MAANNNPIYTATPRISSVQIGAVNTKSDGQGTLGTDSWIAFTAGSNGSYVSRVRLTPTATVAATSTAATVIRVFVSSAISGAVTNATMWLIAEQACAAQTADQTTTGVFSFDIPLNFALPPSYTLVLTTHVANAANTAWMGVVFGGDY
jgi:hypothetical protein